MFPGSRHGARRQQMAPDGPPPIEVSQRDNKYNVRAELPGLEAQGT